MSSPGVLTLALASAGSAGLSTALKHRSTLHADDPHVRRRRTAAVARFLAGTVRSRLWLLAALADLAALGLQVAALRSGALSTVQPLLVTGLVFALLLEHVLSRRRPPLLVVVGSAALAAADVAFLLASGALHPAPPHRPDVAVAAVLTGVLLVVVGLAVSLAPRLPGGAAAAGLGVATGASYAGTAALIKTCTTLAAHHGAAALILSWQLWAAVVSGVAGLVLAQLAFAAGPLTASLPTTASVDPVVGVALGVLVFDEGLRRTPGALVAQVLALVALIGAVYLLSRAKGPATDPAAPPTPDAAYRSHRGGDSGTTQAAGPGGQAGTCWTGRGGCDLPGRRGRPGRGGGTAADGRPGPSG